MATAKPKKKQPTAAQKVYIQATERWIKNAKGCIEQNEKEARWVDTEITFNYKKLLHLKETVRAQKEQIKKAEKELAQYKKTLS